MRHGLPGGTTVERLVERLANSGAIPAPKGLLRGLLLNPRIIQTHRPVTTGLEVIVKDLVDPGIAHFHLDAKTADKNGILSKRAQPSRHGFRVRAVEDDDELVLGVEDGVSQIAAWRRYRRGLCGY